MATFRRGKFRWSDPIKQDFLELLETNGLTNKSARAIGTTKNSLLAELKADVEFQSAYDEALSLYQESIEEEIHRRAVVGVDQQIFHNGELVGSTKKYSDALLKDLAKAQLEKYKNKVQVDTRVSGGVLMLHAPQSTAQDWLMEGEPGTPKSLVSNVRTEEDLAYREAEAEFDAIAVDADIVEDDE